ncbi:uncharacterized protein BDFB_009381 [Asbolus verrucosus]|uniref:Uncharacterized protein n=1 Tax=Asbolus verrucosus TaxID=1661398 RepID=A0A482WD75_ASBVE|nr:uncharacterized protein BDFB_009381 [Asbolus verrucosus]
MTADEKMEWVRSKGGVSDLEEYRLESGSIKETDIYSHEAENKINIICSDAGMGKSILMKNLKNNQPPNIWTIIIYSKDVSSYFREKNKSTNNIDDFISYIIKKTSKKYTDFDSDIVEILRKNNQMVYIWDGLDEISDQNLNNVLDFVAKLSKRGILQWITARCHLKKTLENKFSVLSRTLRKFTDEEQDEYIKERLTHFCPKNELKDIIEKIKYNVKMVQHNDILGIPLQIYMFTELFQQDLEKYKKLLNSIFSITDLYHHFVDEKFNHYYKEKANIKNRNDLTERILDEHKKSRLKKYEKVALKMYFEQNILEDLKINCENFLKRIQEDNDCIGIITEVTENRIPNFWHPSYGEYFAATYFSKNYQRIPKFKEFIFKERYSNVRFLFDLLLAKNFPAHIATLYKNLTVLKNHKEKIKDKDLGGRNPLQLASSWGERYPILNVEHKNDVSVIDDAKGSSVKEENPEYRDILNYLSDKCDIKQVDKMFQMDSLLYADTSLCLLPIVILSGHQKINFHDFKNFNEICTTLYYSVKFGYANIFNLIQEVPYIETKERRSSLLHLSVEYGKLNCLEKILKIGHYKEVINKGDKYGFTPTHIASQKGYADIVKMLIMSEANVNNTDQDKATPIYVASQVGHENIVILLINSGAAVNDSNKSASTPLHAAAQNGHFGVAVALVTSGAKVNLIDKNGATPLYLASQNGHFNIVELLIKSDANVNIADKNKSTPIYTASQGGYYNIVQLLIQSGAETNTCSNDGTTPLHVASQNGHKNVVRLLINSNTFIDCSDKSKATPLYTASENGRTEVVQLLIGSGANINISNKFGYTPVYIASQKKHTTIVQLLVDFKADVNTSGDGGWTPIFVICANGHLEILQILINCGAHINQIDSRGTTPLFIACQNGHIDIAEKLISCGALVNSSDSPIFVASQKGYANIVQLLVDSGADVNICNQFASQEGHSEVVQLLIKAGANVQIAKEDGTTPIYVASQKGHNNVVQLLLKAQANVDRKSNDGKTPVYVASEEGHGEVVKMLIEHKANLNSTDIKGWTPIHVACKNGHFDVVEMLIQSEVDVNITNKDDTTPVHVASENGHVRIVQLLKDSGAKINSTDKDGTTPIHIASQNGQMEVVQLLLSYGATADSINKYGLTAVQMAAQNGHSSVVELLNNS